MAAPLFSVIIPLFNKAAHVREAIESVLSQTLPPQEIIVIDNGSTDGGREIVESISGPIRILDLDRPGPGGYAGRNLGIMAASSEWIAFLDADDLWGPEHLAIIANGIGASPQVVAVATRFTHVFANHSKLQRIARELECTTTLDLVGFLRAWLEVKECPMWTGAIAIRRQTLIDAGLFPDGKAVRGGDKDLWLRVLAKGLLRYDPTPTAVFHRDSENKVSKSTTTLGVPLIGGTARALMAGASSEEVALLRRLVNQEIGHYARYAMKHSGRTAIRMGDLYLPEGLGTAAIVLAARLIPARLRRGGYELRSRLLARA